MNYQNPIDRCKCVADKGGSDMSKCDQAPASKNLLLLLEVP